MDKHTIKTLSPPPKADILELYTDKARLELLSQLGIGDIIDIVFQIVEIENKIKEVQENELETGDLL